MTRLRLIAAVSALIALAAAPAANAHQGNPNYRSVVERVIPKLPGLRLQVLNLDDRLELQNTTGKTVTVSGYQGEPYARLLGNGTVEVNRNSPAYYLNDSRTSTGSVPANAKPGATPNWQVVDRAGRFQWHDHRIHWMSSIPPQQVKDKSKRTKVFDWKVPVQVGTTKGSVDGTLFWAGTGGGAPVGAYAGLAAIALLGLGTVVLVRRRRGGELEPARGAALKTQPTQVVFRFNEPVEGSFGAVRVFDASGKRVDDGRVVHPGGAGPKLAVGIRGTLANGAYTATYRVISADGHPVSGGMVFDMGPATAAAPAKSVADLLQGTKSGPQTSVAMATVKAIGYLAIALALGGMIFLALVWGPALRATALPGAEAPFARRAARLFAVAAGLGVATTAAGIVLEGAEAAGTSFWGALDTRVVGDVLQTHFGTMWALRLAAWALLGAGLAVVALRRVPVALAVPSPAALRPAVAVVGGAGGSSVSSRAGVRGSAQAGGPALPGASPTRNLPGGPAVAIGFGIVGCALALTPALAGHASSQSPRALLMPADVVHVVSMSAWLGGLAFLLVAVPAATRALEPADRTRLLAATLQRFSPLALAAVIALAVTGTVQALIEVRSLDALTSTAFGRAVLVKIVLLTLLIGLGAVNRQRVVPALRALAAGGAAPGAAGRLLRRTLRAEVALIVVILAVTGALTGYPPPTAATAANAGPVSVTQRMGPLELQATIDPARIGPNRVHMYVFDAKTGAPFTATKEITAKASLPSRGIAGLPLTLHRAGPGHYVADAVTLSPGGDWRLAVTDRVSDFDEYTTTVKAAVR